MRIGAAVAAFAGVGSPLTTVKGLEPGTSAEDLQRIEAFYAAKGVAQVTLEVAPWDSWRAPEGYLVAGTEQVLVSGNLFSGQARSDWQVEEIPPEQFVPLMIEGFGCGRDLAVAAASLRGARCFGARKQGGPWKGSALLTPAAGIWILGCDSTLEEARGQGAQRALIGSRLVSLGAGSEAMAEVAPESASERNYLRCGFRKAYARKHYVKAIKS